MSRIPVVRIELDPHWRMGVDAVEFETDHPADDLWGAAQEQLDSWARALEDDCASDVDYTVVFADGEEYHGALSINRDLTVPSDLSRLVEHTRCYLEYIAHRRESLPWHDVVGEDHRPMFESFRAHVYTRDRQLEAARRLDEYDIPELPEEPFARPSTPK